MQRKTFRAHPDYISQFNQLLTHINYPEDLPISESANHIIELITKYPIVIVSGQTGSGKTTQLPKMVLAAFARMKKVGRIVHTQPRRLAATSVASRVAEELKTPLGQGVGYQIRFKEKVSKQTCIKLMTDGVLLAQMQKDPYLRAYDCIIIDEAHERSLNIDFLMGLLKKLSQKRPDLKIIITSATIDAKRFSSFFSYKGRHAPVVEVGGRTYPVEIEYRPIEDPEYSQESGRANADLLTTLVGAVYTCLSKGQGDILVFLPGEREIREARDTLEEENFPHVSILPLFSRLSHQEQQMIFNPTWVGTRIILSTNVAETSLTVPGIRYVIDSGLVRLKRYSIKNKVEQLLIEPISQASANQRSGRCGRLGPGYCIRLYDELDFKQRPEFTDPEMIRSSLANVILRMKSIKIHDIEGFDFLDQPSGRAFADGYQLLHELGAIDENKKLTRLGKLLSQLPLDPRIGRMILEARRQHCLQEILIIASALSIQDPRERPFEKQAQADQAHAIFKDDKSSFLSFLKIWDFYQKEYENRESQRLFIAQMKKQFLHVARLREWKDAYYQLLELVQEQKWALNTKPATFEQIHLALISGLLGHIGFKTEENYQYLGARQIKFYIHPASRMRKQASRWIIASELTQTTKLYARTIANVDPKWIESMGRHLIKKQYSDPQWNSKRGQVIVNERGIIYGLPIYTGRKVNYGQISPEISREIMIRHALVEGDIESKSLDFVYKNLKQVQAIEDLEHRSRRQDILVDDQLIVDFYMQKIPLDIVDQVSLESWYKKLDKKEDLLLNKDDLMQHQAHGINSQLFPKQWRVHEGFYLKLSYHFEPGSLKDGVTLDVPVYSLNQINPVQLEWLVPGLLKEKVLFLLKSLPQRIRKHCVPVGDYAQDFSYRHFADENIENTSLIDAICQDIWEQRQIRVLPEQFKVENLPLHLRMNIRVIDEHGRMLSSGRNIFQLKAEFAQQATSHFQEIAFNQSESLLKTQEITTWDFGTLPEILEIQKKGQSLIGYPAIVDCGTYCEIDVFDEVSQAQEMHDKGVLRLYYLALKQNIKLWKKAIPNITQMAMMYMNIGTQESLEDELILSVIEQIGFSDTLPVNQKAFEERVSIIQSKMGLILQERARLLYDILQQYQQCLKKLSLIRVHKQAYEDIENQIKNLIYPHFLLHTNITHLSHYSRYLKGIILRIERLQNDPQKDMQLMTNFYTLYTPYQRKLGQMRGKVDQGLKEFRWQLEELRIALFAQTLRTPMPVSIKRLQKIWNSLSY